ncbi:MAG: hypothetical protein Q9226_006499 [Calogaya cf. arnoldii]
MHPICFLSAFLLPNAFALPALPNPSPSLRNPSPQDIGTTINGTLLALRDDLPWGPPIFSIDIEEQSTSPIDRRVLFITTIQLLAVQAPLDFNAPLTSDILFRLPQFPNLQISIISLGHQGPVLRKYIFWAMARIMQEMITRDRFVETVYNMKLRGRFFAVLGISNPNKIQSSATIDAAVNEKEITADVTAATTNQTNAISAGFQYGYEHFGEGIGQAAIFMGIIGAMFKVAGQLNHDFESFHSAFTQYRFYCFWGSKQRPSRFTFDMLVQGIVGAAKFAVAKNVWRELRAQVYVDGVLVAYGGWFTLPDIPPVVSLASS